ncbi:hypothetical protein ACFX2J_035806 [Malus domestica]
MAAVCILGLVLTSTAAVKREHNSNELDNKEGRFLVGRLRRVVQPPNVVRKHYLPQTNRRRRLEEGISKRKAQGGFAIHATHQRVAADTEVQRTKSMRLATKSSACGKLTRETRTSGKRHGAGSTV